MTTHTIFGAGQIGLPLAARLASQGTEVRLVRRGLPGPDIDGVTWCQGDVRDPDFAAACTEGAAVVYNCMNPAAYHRWPTLLPPLVRGVLRATRRAGARLVCLDNLYMYGAPDGPMREDSPLQPCSEKGALRAELAAELQDAHQRGDVEIAIGRASDFFGPSAPRAAIFHDRFFERVARGASVEVFGDPDRPHAYSYTLDVVEGLATLGSSDEAFGRVWHLPVSSQETTRALIERFANALGQAARVRSIPRWMLRMAGWFVPIAGAVVEMTYQWETDFRVDDGAFRSTFGVEPTPVDVAVDATLRARGLAA
ncbi:MAG: NAD-dependent epimerase/dehydratase family protein [Myxococcota bacterium]